MYANRFTAVLDANVLAPALSRNVLLSLAREGFYRQRLRNPPISVSDLIYAFEQNGRTQSANQIAPLVELL